MMHYKFVSENVFKSEIIFSPIFWLPWGTQGVRILCECVGILGKPSKKKTKKILKNVKMRGGGGFGAGPCQKKKP